MKLSQFSFMSLFLLHTTSVVASPRQEILQAAPQISAGSIFNFSISSTGLNRRYLLSIPPNYYPGIPTPVILSYHGGTKTAEDQLQLDQLTNPEFNTQAIVVYPQGIDVSQFPRDIISIIRVLLSRAVQTFQISKTPC